MTARVLRLLGQALVWLVVLAIAAPMFTLALPVIAFGLIGRGLYELLRVLVRREEVDGSSDGGEPDALTPELRDQIDGRRTAAVERVMEFLAEDDGEVGALLVPLLGCGCLDVAWPQHACPRCDWRTCLGHAGAHHYCVGDELPRRGAPLPAAVEAAVNDAFASIINRSNVGDLKRTDEDLARFYLIGDEK